MEFLQWGEGLDKMGVELIRIGEVLVKMGEVLVRMWRCKFANVNICYKRVIQIYVFTNYFKSKHFHSLYIYI